MRLATFLSNDGLGQLPPDMLRPWEEVLGRTPVFAFPARDDLEFAFGCFWFAPVMPERVVIFESDDWIPYDTVAWRRVIHPADDTVGDVSSADVEAFLSQADRPVACGVVVPGIADVIADVDVAFHVTTPVAVTEDDDDALMFIARYYDQAFAEALDMMLDADSQSFDRESRAVLLKEIFSETLASCVYAIYVNELPELLMPLSVLRVEEEMRPDMVDMLFSMRDRCMGSRVTHWDWDLMRSVFEDVANLFYETEAKPALGGLIGPNSPCPCGSGKKFKRCHRRFRYSLPADLPDFDARRWDGTLPEAWTS